MYAVSETCFENLQRRKNFPIHFSRFMVICIIVRFGFWPITRKNKQTSKSFSFEAHTKFQVPTRITGVRHPEYIAVHTVTCIVYRESFWIISFDGPRIGRCNRYRASPCYVSAVHTKFVLDPRHSNLEYGLFTEQFLFFEKPTVRCGVVLVFDNRTVQCGVVRFMDFETRTVGCGAVQPHQSSPNP